MERKNPASGDEAMKRAASLSLIYFFFSILWIFFSDTILSSLNLPVSIQATISMIKGWLFVMISALLFFFFLKKSGGNSASSNTPKNENIKKFFKNDRRDWFDPVILIAVFVFVIGLLLWMIYLNTNRTLDKDMHIESQSVKRSILLRLNGNEEYLRMLAQERASGNLTEYNFHQRISRYLSTHKEFINITWVDSNFIIKTVTPFENNKQIIGLKIVLPEPRKASLEALKTKQPVYTSPFEAIQGKSSFEIWVPVFKGSRFMGFFAGVYSCEKILDNILSDQIKFQYYVRMLNKDGGLLGSTKLLGPRENSSVQKVTLNLSNTEISLLVTRYGSVWNWILVFFGIFIIGLIIALGYGVYLLKVDIAVRKNTEKALFESQQLLQSIIDNSPNVIYVFDTEGKCSLVNKKFKSLIDPTIENFEGKTRHEFLPKEFADSHRNNDLAVLNTGSPQSFEEEIMYNDEKRFYLTEKFPLYNPDGNISAVCGISTDITERKQIENAIKQSEEKFNKAFHNSPDAITLTRASDGFLVDVNDSFQQLSGYAPEEVLGRTSLNLNLWVDQEDRKKYIALLKEYKTVKDFETKFKTKSGEQRDFLLSGEIFEINKEIYILGIIRDITDRKKSEEEIRKLNAELESRVSERTAQLEAANKELEAFSYSVSHDLRSPLRSIDGFSQALFEDYFDKLNDEGKDYINRVRAAAQKMASLIDDMLNLAHVNRITLQPKKIDISDVAESIAASLKESEPERDIQFKIEPNLVAMADLSLIKVVLQNLFENSCKFTSKKEGAVIEFGKLENDNSIVYFVKDNGAGFNMKYLNKLFNPFQRLHNTNEFKGTGIGLATVQRIIHRHCGKIWAEGEPEKGATFFFTLNM